MRTSFVVSNEPVDAAVFAATLSTVHELGYTRATVDGLGRGRYRQDHDLPSLAVQGR